MIKVEGHPHLYRDGENGAIINCDDMGYNQYVNSLRQKELQKNELDKMKDDINEIKSLLKKLTMGDNINI